MPDFWKELHYGSTNIKARRDGFHVTDFTQTLIDQHIQTSFDVDSSGSISDLHTTTMDRATGQKCIIPAGFAGSGKIRFS